MKLSISMKLSITFPIELKCILSMLYSVVSPRDKIFYDDVASFSELLKEYRYFFNIHRHHFVL